MLTGILVLAGIAGGLALLLELADRFINNYPDCRITINGEKEITVPGGSPLLYALQDQGIFIPSACGGRGTCAYCKVKVEEGGGNVLATEIPYLSEEETKDGVRLSCQVKVRRDLKIVIPEELFLVKEFRVRAEKIKRLTPFIKEFTFRILEDEEGITFKSGQYVQLEIPPYKLTKTAEFRAYSIGSSAEEHDVIRLYIAKVKGGIVTTYLHDYLKEGDELVMRGPFGEFYYRESGRDMLLIATGSGLAPILAILEHMENTGIKRKATLFFGSRVPEELYEQDRIAEMTKRLKDFTSIPVLSRTTEEHGWTGEKGRVTDLIRKHVPEGADLDVYICGSTAMIDDSAALLKGKGVPAAQINYDRFD